MPRAQNDFYRGLLNGSDSENISETVRLFEKALVSSNVYIRRAAAEELANLMSRGTELSLRTMGQVRREAAGLWAAIFDAAGNEPDREKVLELLLGFEQWAENQDVRLFILRECAKLEIFFSERELAAIDGHYAVSLLRYNEALVFFRVFQEDGAWPEPMPQIFLEYPGLIGDLGRAFQYTDAGNEGLDLYLRWEAGLADSAAHSPEADAARFTLLFYAARIARRAGKAAQGISLFEQALHLAPDAGQEDACLWYILDMSLGGSSGVFLQRLERFFPIWHNSGYFNDIMEKYLHQLVSQRDWGRVVGAFDLIRHGGSTVSIAGFAWVIARAIEEGYLSGAQMRLASDAEYAAPSDFMRIAYNVGEVFGTQALYYRLLSAAALRLPFLEFSQEAAPEETGDPSQALQFLLGFFNNNVSRHALRYIRSLERELAPGELRSVAAALAQAGMYSQSIRLVSLYINREGYTRDRRDLELLFPRHYIELVETYAKEAAVAPPLLFGLIRTESAFQNAVVSHAGAVGLTQLMPATAQDMADRMRRLGGTDYTANLDLSDPSLNIHIGSYYLNYLIGRFEGDTMLSLMAYNGGMNRVRRWRTASSLPADLFLETVAIYETRDYGRRVMSAAAVYEELYYRQDR